MASILKVDTLTGVTTAGSISVTGEGNSTTTNLQQGLAKAWSRSSSSALVDSFNCSGFTDNGAGDFTVAFSNAFSNSTFAGTISPVGANSRYVAYSASATTSIDLDTFNTSASRTDTPTAFQICGDLA
jgi:hypothetical protein